EADRRRRARGERGAEDGGEQAGALEDHADADRRRGAAERPEEDEAGGGGDREAGGDPDQPRGGLARLAAAQGEQRERDAEQGEAAGERELGVAAQPERERGVAGLAGAVTAAVAQLRGVEADVDVLGLA